MLVEYFYSLQATSEEVKGVILAIREALIKNTTGDALCDELQLRVRPDAFISAVLLRK